MSRGLGDVYKRQVLLVRNARRYILRRNKAQKVVKILDKILKLEANSASCMFAYEPKAPKELERFKKTK